MMTNEYAALCRRLYELKPELNNELILRMEWKGEKRNRVIDYPRYTFIYLFDILPPSIHFYRTKNGDGRATDHGNGPLYDGTTKGSSISIVALKLAIRLAEEGLL